MFSTRRNSEAESLNECYRVLHASKVRAEESCRQHTRLFPTMEEHTACQQASKEAREQAEQCISESRDIENRRNSID